MRKGSKRLGDARSGFVVPAGAGVSVGREAQMKGFEPAGSYLLRLAQTGLDLVEARRLALLRQSPAEMGQPKACQSAIDLSSARRNASRAPLSTRSGRRSQMYATLAP